MGFWDSFKRSCGTLNPERSETAGDHAIYGGGDGSSMDTAVVIHASSTRVGIHAECAYVALRHGQSGRDWTPESQSLLAQDGRHFDVVNIKTRDGCVVSYYFDISSFFGKF